MLKKFRYGHSYFTIIYYLRRPFTNSRDGALVSVDKNVFKIIL